LEDKLSFKYSEQSRHRRSSIHLKYIELIGNSYFVNHSLTACYPAWIWAIMWYLAPYMLMYIYVISTQKFGCINCRHSADAEKNVKAFRIVYKPLAE